MERDPTAPGATADLTALLGQSGWLRALAAHLVRGGEEADDLVQETWLNALRSPPGAGRPQRPWLAQVLRNVWRMGARGASRRRARELETGLPAAELSPEQLLERAQLQRHVAELVMALDEPYRTAILLYYYEGQPSAEIARALRVPAGTVRWRINQGLVSLRARLDQEHQGQRRTWAVVLLPLAGPETPPLPAGPAAVSKLVFTTLAATTLMGVGAALWMGRARPPSTPPKSVAGQLSPDHTAKTTPDQEESMTRARTKLAAFFGVALPALVAAAQDEKPLSRDENIAFCMEFRERTVVCKEELSHLFAEMAPPSTTPEQRERIRQKALKEIEQDGTGPVEPRRAKCAASVDRGFSFTQGEVKAGRACMAEKDCKKSVACMRPHMEAKHKKPHKK
jgi:RNA polymerase sigma factor (sigma-70 family)